MLLVPLPVGRAFNFRNKPSNYEHLSCSMCIDFSLFNKGQIAQKYWQTLYRGEGGTLEPVPLHTLRIRKISVHFFCTIGMA